MSLSAHLDELSEKHKTLQNQIEKEMARPLVDSLRIADLKRRKLRIKEKIEKIKVHRDVA